MTGVHAVQLAWYAGAWPVIRRHDVTANMTPHLSPLLCAAGDDVSQVQANIKKSALTNSRSSGVDHVIDSIWILFTLFRLSTFRTHCSCPPSGNVVLIRD